MYSGGGVSQKLYRIDIDIQLPFLLVVHFSELRYTGRVCLASCVIWDHGLPCLDSIKNMSFSHHVMEMVTGPCSTMEWAVGNLRGSEVTTLKEFGSIRSSLQLRAGSDICLRARKNGAV